MSAKSITFAGSVILLRFTLKSLCRMQDEHQVNVFESETFTKPSPTLSCVIVWGALIHAQPKLTLVDIQDGFASLQEFAAAHRAALTELVETLPKSNEAEKPAGTT